MHHPRARPAALSAALTTVISATLLAGAALALATPASAAESLEITAPVPSSTVSGEVRIEGVIVGDGMTDLALSLAPESLGECGAPVASTESEVVAGEPFAAVIDTTQVADGAYCIIAVADGGTLSEVRGGIVVANERGADGDVQLPTLALPDGSGKAAGGGSSLPGDAGPLLAGLVFGLAALAAAAVAVFGVMHDRRPARR